MLPSEIDYNSRIPTNERYSMSYEWLSEEYDEDGNITDVNHFDTVKEVVSYLRESTFEHGRFDVALRYTDKDGEWSYAYALGGVLNGLLDYQFRDAYNQAVKQVPRKYMMEWQDRYK